MERYPLTVVVETENHEFAGDAAVAVAVAAVDKAIPIESQPIFLATHRWKRVTEFWNYTPTVTVFCGASKITTPVNVATPLCLAR